MYTEHTSLFNALQGGHTLYLYLPPLADFLF